MSCLLAGTLAVTLATPGFTLSWTHSVERVRWRESWVIEGTSLRLVDAAVHGSGAGMEAGDGAQLQDGWWIWKPDVPPLPQLLLASSGTTGGAWRLCDAAKACHEIGAAAGAPIVLAPCPVA